MEQDEEVHRTQIHAKEHASLQPMIIRFSNWYALREKELSLESMKIPLQGDSERMVTCHGWSMRFIYQESTCKLANIYGPRRRENGYKLIFNIKHRPNDDLRHTWLKKDIYKLNE